MKINVESKFNLNQKVYCIEPYTTLPVCKTCEGEGKVLILAKSNKEPFKAACPHCNGSGKNGKYELKLFRLRTQDPWTIGTLYMTIHADEYGEQSFRYGIQQRFGESGGCFCSTEEKYCFATKEEAQARIEELNKNPKRKYFDEDYEYEDEEDED